MKDLQQAVNIKRWPGNGEAPKPWGKLKQDPELWDDRGDTMIFFGRGRSDAAFRISSSLFRGTGSDTMIDMLLYGTVRSEAATRGVSHKIYLEPPASCTEKLEMLRFHITTRNVFAFLLGKPIVGFSFQQALDDLAERLEEYLAPVIDCAASLKAFLVATGLINVSNQPGAAVGLLAWSESVRWYEGWREAFVHAAGMYPQVERLSETADLSSATRAHLQKAHLEMRVRIHEAEDRLSTFSFDERHTTHRDKSSAAQSAANAFRKFLKQHYEKRFQAWPPRMTDRAGPWLDRRLTNLLQRDFAAVYEYCVDRNVAWEGDDESYNEKSSSRKKHRLVRLDNGEDAQLEVEDDRMVAIFQNLGRIIKASDMPHPLPLLPAPVPPCLSQKKSVFSKGKKDRVRESRVLHAYVAASNAASWDREFAANDLARAYAAFEASDGIDTIDPREARRGRWIILYCVLQTLAGIAVDVPQLSYKDEVEYFLNTRLEDLPPWAPKVSPYPEADRSYSYCWTAPQKWSETSKLDLRDNDDESYDSRPLSLSSFSAQERRSELAEREGSLVRSISPSLRPAFKGLATNTPSLLSQAFTGPTLNGARSTISSQSSNSCASPRPPKITRTSDYADYASMSNDVRPKRQIEPSRMRVVGLG